MRGGRVVLPHGCAGSLSGDVPHLSSLCTYILQKLIKNGLFSCFRDAERKRKVKQLFNSLAEQEGEWKALKRKKFKK